MNKVSENPFKNRTQWSISRSSLFVVVVALFVTLYLISNIMASKIISIGGFCYFDAGTVTFPFAYMLGDVLTEIWGYRTTRKVIVMTLVCNLLMVLCTQLGVWLPSPDYLAESALAYNTTFSYVPRIVVASLVGFALGEISNAWCMERIKKATEGRHLWLRTIGSSLVGHLTDTVPFVLIAFAGRVTTHDLLLMIGFQYAMKLAIEVLFGTPLAYATIGTIKRHIDPSSNN